MDRVEVATTEDENITGAREASLAQEDQPLRQRMLSRWDNEGGATRYGPQRAVAREAQVGALKPKTGEPSRIAGAAEPRAATSVTQRSRR